MISALGRPKQIDFCKLQAGLGYGSDFKVSLRYNSNLSLEQNKAPKLQVRASSREKIYNQDIGKNRQGREGYSATFRQAWFTHVSPVMWMEPRTRPGVHSNTECTEPAPTLLYSRCA